MKTLIYYIVYLIVGYSILIATILPIFSEVIERAVATIFFWTFIWALSVTQVVGVGKLLRRFSK